MVIQSLFNTVQQVTSDQYNELVCKMQYKYDVHYSTRL